MTLYNQPCMRRAVFALLIGVLPSTVLFGQGAPTATQIETFHVRGTIKDRNDAVIRNATVTFSGERSAGTVTTGVGTYDIDLPLGVYTMIVQANGFEPYRRPAFRVNSPTSLLFNATLQIGGCGDMIIVPLTDENIYQATKRCRHYDQFAVPGQDGTPFKLYIQFPERLAGGGDGYVGEDPYNPVMVAYNLFSLHADQVTYDEKKSLLRARGNVVVEDESGEHTADDVTYKIKNGSAVRIP